MVSLCNWCISSSGEARGEDKCIFLFSVCMSYFLKYWAFHILRHKHRTQCGRSSLRLWDCRENTSINFVHKSIHDDYSQSVSYLSSFLFLLVTFLCQELSLLWNRTELWYIQKSHFATTKITLSRDFYSLLYVG